MAEPGTYRKAIWIKESIILERIKGLIRYFQISFLIFCVYHFRLKLMVLVGGLTGREKIRAIK